MFTKAIYGITPSGTKSITANGNYDVTNYATASVSISGAPAGTKLIDANGIYNISEYAEVNVNVNNLSSTLLWANPTPNIDSGNYSTLSLNDYIYNYKYIQIDYKPSLSDNSTTYTVIVPRATLSDREIYAISYTPEDTYPVVQYIRFFDKTAIHNDVISLGSLLKLSWETMKFIISDESYCIPLRIYGLN